MHTRTTPREDSKAEARDPSAGCTLGADDFADRLAWIRQEILPHAVETRRLDRGLAFELAPSPGLADTLDRLIALERECCSGIVIERLASAIPGRLRLEVRGIDPDAAVFRSPGAPDAQAPPKRLHRNAGNRSLGIPPRYRPVVTKRILMAAPCTDFDPTESGVPWNTLRRAGHDVVLTTPDGEPASADPRVLTGCGFGPLAPFLRAHAEARAAYDAMIADEAFSKPLSFEAVVPSDYDAVLLPGGHAPGMKPYLESERLFEIVRHFFEAGKPVAAICHGVLVPARARDAAGTSLLHGRRVTALLKSQEMLAWGLTTLWLGDYYRTYPTPVQTEITRCLAEPADFEEGPTAILRDEEGRLDRGFVVRDGNLVTARWPGDAHRLAHEFAAMLA